MEWHIELFGPELCIKEGLKQTCDALKDKKLVALYFAAHWCPPCRQFTPSLSKFYKNLLLERPDSIEIIFVSNDNDEASFKKHWDSQPWIALPFSSDKKSVSTIHISHSIDPVTFNFVYHVYCARSLLVSALMSNASPHSLS